MRMNQLEASMLTCPGNMLNCSYFVLRFLYMLGGSCTGGMCHSSYGMHAICCCDCYRIFREKDYGWIDNALCWFDIRFVDDLHFSDPYMLSSLYLLPIRT